MRRPLLIGSALLALEGCGPSPSATMPSSESDAQSDAETAAMDSGGSAATSETGSGPAFCGNGVVEAPEACDDANAIDDDGCDHDCVASAVVEVSAHLHTCVRTRTGALRCWGRSVTAELGYGDADLIGTNVLPAAAGVVALDGSVVQVSAGQGSTCAVLDGGALRCWGEGLAGKLGYGVAEVLGDDESPASAGDVPVGAAVVQVSTGYFHTCAVVAGGGVRCWGPGRDALLGYTETSLCPLGPCARQPACCIGDDESAGALGDVPIGGPVLQVAVGTHHTCALLDDGGVRCWGSAEYGRLGYGNSPGCQVIGGCASAPGACCIGDDELLADAGDVDVGGRVVQLDTGSYGTCAVLESGGVRCWGRGERLGYGSTNDVGDDETPSSVGDVDVGEPVAEIFVGDQHTCALLRTGNVRCWGSGFSGALGYGSPDDIGDDETPASVGDVPIGEPVVDLAVGALHTCAVLESGALRCWGHGAHVGRAAAPGCEGIVTCDTGPECCFGDDEPVSDVPDVIVF